LAGVVQRVVPVVFSLIMFCVIGFLAYMYYPENYFALQYQAVIDCRRIQAVHTIADLAERYKEKKGYYPLSNNFNVSSKDEPPIATSVIITNKALPKSYMVNPPDEIEGKMLSPHRFEEEVGRVLGIKVKLPYDPQTNFAWEKRFYLYKVMPSGQYTVSGILFSATEHTQKQGDHRHRYQVGSMPSRDKSVRVYKNIKYKFV